MDICLIETLEGTHVRPASIHGMLWLQTHFEDSNWEAIASNQVTLPREDAQELLIDAESAGLCLNYLPAVSVSRKF